MRKFEVRKQIRTELGLEFAKLFDELYKDLKTLTLDDILLTSPKSDYDSYRDGKKVFGGRGWTGLVVENPSQIIELLRITVINNIKRLKAHTEKFRAKNPDCGPDLAKRRAIIDKMAEKYGVK